MLQDFITNIGEYWGSLLVAGIGTCYFVWLYIHANRQVDAAREQLQNEMNESPDIYNGPLGEPRWDGLLPDAVGNYREPRYVYENLEESVVLAPENGRVIGYRISPTLVIHSRFKRDVSSATLPSYLERYGGSLLTEAELRLFMRNLGAIEILCRNLGCEALNINRCWYTSRGIAEIAIFNEDDEDEAPLLILKR